MWSAFVRGLVWLGISILLTPRQKSEAPPPPSAEDIDVPKAKEGEAFGRIYGTVRIADMQCHWFGDHSLRPITTKQSKK